MSKPLSEVIEDTGKKTQSFSNSKATQYQLVGVCGRRTLISRVLQVVSAKIVSSTSGDAENFSKALSGLVACQQRPNGFARRTFDTTAVDGIGEEVEGDKEGEEAEGQLW
jgi:hypothetical protein